MNEPARSYELTFEERDGYLYAHVKAATINEEIAMQAYLREIADRCNKIKCKHLMIYRDIPAMLDNVTLFFVTNAFAEWTRGIKMAIVNPHLSNAVAMEFSELLAINVGAFEHVFNNIADAEAWLLK